MVAPIRQLPARIALTCLVIALQYALAPRSGALPPSYPEASVKAVYLYRFAGYVEWPPEVLARPRFTVAVLNDDEVADALARVLPEHRIGGRPAEVRIAHRTEDLAEAQVVYIGSAYRGNLQALIAKLAGQPVLVVTDAQDALESGSTVNFVETDHRVRFEISVAAAARAGLKISSQLLSVAVRVRTGSLGVSSRYALAMIVCAASPGTTCAPRTP